MELRTISDICRQFGISTRTLRYYEQIGILRSQKKPGYAYRVYDEDAFRRLQQILILRKLRIPLKQIDLILRDPQMLAAMNVFRENIAALTNEIDALTTIRTILQSFVDVLEKKVHLPRPLDLLDDASLLKAIDSLAVTKLKFKEDASMDELNKADEKLSRLTDVRIVYLPPATVAASHYVGDDPEMYAGQRLEQFVIDANLKEIKPDVRHYGFNHPNPVDETNAHGYEMWVTIPDDMEAPAPLEKKHFPGGLYAAHVIQMGNFHEWEWLNRWVSESDQYEYRGDWSGENMFGWLEEHLNYINHISVENGEPEGMQLDLLIPIHEKKK